MKVPRQKIPFNTANINIYEYMKRVFITSLISETYREYRCPIFISL